MSNTISSRRRIVISLLVAVGFIGAAGLGALVGMNYKLNRLLFELPRTASAVEAFRYSTGLRKYYAAGQQDMWVALVVEPGKHNGYYVDVGSADGVIHSNTYLFDKMGWHGVCIDPFPTNMKNRTCCTFRQPVFSVSGKKMVFREAGENGGIVDTMGRYDAPTAKAKTVELVTATLDEILEQAQAPHHIDYVSIDVEGAEYEVLKGFSLDKYEVDAFTIEHNNETEKREAMRQLLESKGYQRVRSWVMDDWYVRRGLGNRYEFTFAFGYRI